jgi:hypothetical protein
LRKVAASTRSVVSEGLAAWATWWESDRMAAVRRRERMDMIRLEEVNVSEA